MPGLLSVLLISVAIVAALILAQKCPGWLANRRQAQLEMKLARLRDECGKLAEQATIVVKSHELNFCDCVRMVFEQEEFGIDFRHVKDELEKYRTNIRRLNERILTVQNQFKAVDSLSDLERLNTELRFLMWSPDHWTNPRDLLPEVSIH